MIHRNPAVQCGLLLAGFTAAMSAQATASEYSQERPCLTPRIPFSNVTVEPPAERWCAQPEKKLSLCVQRQGPDDEEITAEIISQGKSVKLRISGLVPLSFDRDSLFLQRMGTAVDAPYFFAVRKSISNGLGVERWTGHAARTAGWSAPADLVDLGVLSFLTSGPGATRCRLLAADWSQGFDPRRGGGTYVIGTWWSFEDHAWARSFPSQDINVHRRYLFPFQRQRGARMGSTTARPLVWYTDATASPGPPPQENPPRQK